MHTSEICLRTHLTNYTWIYHICNIQFIHHLIKQVLEGDNKRWDIERGWDPTNCTWYERSAKSNCNKFIQTSDSPGWRICSPTNNPATYNIPSVEASDMTVGLYLIV